ncbi:MAG: ankyrin repeat domain-containing protein [Gemmatimonadetes bacterium]|nr:ankyrin repeat domain-containing protein [Gemmatimonadota bacterium]
MSESHASPAGGDPRALDRLRHQAKRLLKQARAGDAVVIARLAVARKLGHEHWGALKAYYETLDPIHEQAARFLAALREDDAHGAAAHLEATPAIARYSIHTAAAASDVTLVRAFLDADAALANEPDPGGHLSPLVYAVQQDLRGVRGTSEEDQLEAVRALLDAGADPNAAAPLPDGSDSIPALYFPCAAGNVALARLLLERGAKPTDGESLYHAAQHGHEACLALLVAFGADVHRGPARHGNTPLHFLVAHTPGNRITETALRGMQWLLEHGADPNVPSYAGRQKQPQAGETPLHRAAAVGHDIAVLRALVDAGADVNLRRDDGATAYQLAVRAGRSDVAAFLAEAGADPSLRPADRLLAACMAGDAEAARAEVAATPGLIASLGPSERDALGIALTHGRDDTVRLMLALGWPLTQEGEWGGTPLHWAAWNGRVAMVKLLLEAGAPVNVRDSRYGSSPIAWCAHGSRFSERGNDEDYPAIIHLLLDAGATRPESYNAWSEPPESLARPSVVAVLKARGFAV